MAALFARERLHRSAAVGVKIWREDQQIVACIRSVSDLFSAREVRTASTAHGRLHARSVFACIFSVRAARQAGGDARPAGGYTVRTKDAASLESSVPNRPSV